MKTKVKTLIFDIETKPIQFNGWRTGKQYMGHEQIVEGKNGVQDIICISYSWLGEAKIYTLHWGCRKQNSAPMIERFTKIVESADIPIAHNGDRFDIKHINTQRWLHGQAPIDWPTSEDTLKQIKKHFALPSYRLDYLLKLIGHKGKDKMHFSDWTDIRDKKCPKAFAKMIKYNRNDVRGLKAVYKKFFEYLTPKVNASLIAYGNKDGCPRCGEFSARSNGIRYTKAGRYRRLTCTSCRHPYKGTKL